MKIFVSTLLSLFLLVFATGAWALEPPSTLAKSAFMMDFDTGTILYDKNADLRMPTASMSKIMTMIVVFDAVKSGKLSLEQTLPVSEKAWKVEGSKMFIEVGKQIKVEDLVRGVIIQSGNDACITLAEGLAGTEEAFAQMMNVKARELGLTGSNFTNATGLPDPNHYSTPKDLALMARYLIAVDKDYYKYYSETEFTYNNIRQPNRNPLLYAGIGADGVKTGHTEEAGYGLVGSATRDGRRVIMVVSGMASMQERADESQKLMDWGLRSFRNVQVAKVGDKIDTAPVVLGAVKEVPLTVEKDILLTIPSIDTAGIKFQSSFDAPLTAPLAKGAKAGEFIISYNGAGGQSYPLVVAEDVAPANIFARTLEKALLRIVGAPKYQ